MQRKTKRNILLIFFAIIVIAGIVGYSIWNEPHRNVKNATALKTTAVQLYSDLTKDSANMKSKFVNKVVEVSGEIKQVSKNQNGDQIILLKTNIPDGSVNCTMEEQANNVKPGNTISIKGICSGYIGGDLDMGLSGDVFLIRCYPSI
jgi:archaellum component FlaF (FlaF/FlaG flagellin family)